MTIELIILKISSHDENENNSKAKRVKKRHNNKKYQK